MDKKFSFFLENSNFKNEVKTNEVKAKRSSTKWSSKETELFYEALKVCGLEFTLMSEILTNKSRKQIKNKYLRENKLYKDKIEEILRKKSVFDRNLFEKLKQKKI